MSFVVRPRIAVCCAALVLVLSACVSSPTPESEVWEVTPGASFASDYGLNASNSGYIQITRDSGNSGSACTTSVVVGNRSAARLRPAERVTVRVATGEYKVTAEIVGMCPGLMSEQMVHVAPGVTKRLRIRYGEVPGAFGIVAEN
ncbi:hypothetical protein VVD49_17035 [Uliginosibacterium sp. H3]|uniref:Lipoprotein n=1 Tax=Uliginosibacterium silvisoli TaxID=3114758 RepID=A0ABU6K6B0_9RHOO|nr:hypothetical protein [Uliginosibacterium sp. H3]